MKKVYAFLLIFFSFTIPLFAQEANEAVSILSKLYCPSGQSPVNDILIEYEQMDSGGSASTMSLGSKDKIYFKNPAKIRVDSIMVDPGGVNDGKALIIIRDGLNAWLYLSTGQYPVKKKLDEPSPPLNLPFGLTRYPEDLDRKFKIEGRENIEGVNALKISITEPTGVRNDVWIDTQRNVPVQLISTKKIKTKDSERLSVKKVIYKDFGKTKDGRYFPMKLEKYSNNDLVSLVIYKAIVVNTGLEDHLFEPMEKLLK